MLDYRIKTFLTVYDEMNYRRAAEILNMTQPGVTKHIQYIENYYGAKLFSYNGKALLRTKQADILKAHIESILSEEKEIFKAFSEKEKTVLNIGATKTIGEFVLVPMVRKFLKDESRSVNLTVDNTEKLLAMLRNAELDFAVIEGIFDKTRYPFRLLKKEHFVGICSENHPFANKKVSLSEVFGENLILREKGSGTRLLLEQAINDRGYSLDCFRRVISVSNFSVITDMVANERAVTFAYTPVAKSRKGLAQFTVRDMSINGEFNFVYLNRKAEEKIKLFTGENT